MHAFVAELLARKLVIETERASPADGAATEPRSVDRAAFVPPALTIYEDMADLLLLDPIHDVDEAGWPMPKAADAGTQ